MWLPVITFPISQLVEQPRLVTTESCPLRTHGGSVERSLQVQWSELDLQRICNIDAGLIADGGAGHGCDLVLGKYAIDDRLLNAVRECLPVGPLLSLCFRFEWIRSKLGVHGENGF